MGAWFTAATFQGTAWFTAAIFQDAAWFAGATFQGDAWFEDATFQDTAWFKRATFQRTAGFDGAHVLSLDDPGVNTRHVWPDGYIVQPDPTDPTRGTLVHAEQTEESEPAVHPPSTGGHPQDHQPQ